MTSDTEPVLTDSESPIFVTEAVDGMLLTFSNARSASANRGNHFRRNGLSIDKFDLNLVSCMHHVCGGHDQAFFVNDDTGSNSATLPRTAIAANEFLSLDGQDRRIDFFKQTAAGVTEDGKVAQASSRGPVSWEGVRYFDSESDAPKSKPDVTDCFGGYPMWTRVDLWEEAKRERLRVVHTDDDGYVLATGPRGNSFSGPHAAGVAALMLEANPDLPVWQVKRLMESTCSDLGPEGRDTTFGAGMLQAGSGVLNGNFSCLVLAPALR